jgi:LmbE family N-acetylglucosaminyl deacetylase
MQQIIFGIFAHPDDETLVAGTLMKKSADGAEINLVVATDGQAGSNPIDAPDLGQTRLDEWQHSAEIISAQSTHALHYEDGQLNSRLQPAIESDIKDLVIAHLATMNEEAEVSLITFDTDGLTGHSDHCLVTSAVMHVYQDLASLLPPNVRLGKLLCCRLSNEQAAAGPTTVQFPLAGYPIDEMDQVTDVSDFVSRKKAVMSCHLTQVNDMEKWKQLGDELLGIECFRIIDQES